MCVVAAYRFDDGWKVAKNRDRNYIPDISFKKRTFGKVHYRTFLDNDTFWCEGLNNYGIGVLNSALMIKDDEKALDKVKKKGIKISHDGDIIKKALREKKIENTVELLVKGDVFGHTFITDGESLYVIENVRKKVDLTGDGEKETVQQKLSWYKVVDESVNYLVRTNHGEEFDDTGYPINTNAGKSSRKRREYVEKEIEKKKPKNIIELMDCLNIEPDKNPELNPIRKKEKGCKLFTTGQIGIDVTDKTLYYRPLKSKLVNKNDIEGDTNVKILKEDFITFREFLNNKKGI